jgi:acyl-CoA synthetase (AMP-forming)/AMP-acid ligase II
LQFQLADLYECLCDARPDAEVLVAGARRVTRRELDERANRLAHHLVREGISRGDHVGVYAHNRVEWVEVLLACWKIGAATVNVNFRYVVDELRYLWENAGLSALVYESSFAGPVAELAPEFPELETYLVLDDRAGAPGAAAPGSRYETALAACSCERGFAPRSADDLYLVYTGGTTGMPKGVLWRHEDFYKNVVGALAGALERPEDIARQADNPLGLRTLTLSPLMHGGGQFPLFITVLNGGVALLPLSRQFDPEEVLGLIERERVRVLSIIGDAMGRPLAVARLGAGDAIDTGSLVAISSGGAILSAPVRELLRSAFGKVVLTGGIGSSEIGSAARESGAFDAITGPRFRLDETVAVLDEGLRRIGPGSGGVGRLARCGHIPLGYHNDPEKTAVTFVIDSEGTRWVLPGDWARVEDDSTISLLGRGSACINSGGEKIFPDEVEGVVVRHPAVRHAAVVGVPDPTWGERVVALVELLDGVEAPSLAELQAHCRAHLAGYKVPRDLVLGALERTATGKVDLVRARERAQRALA